MGPASAKKEVLSQMFLAGVDVCRLNFSHGSYEDHLATMRLIREINSEYNINVAILCDLQGPKIRIGELKKEFLNLVEGETIHFTTNKKKASDEYLFITYQNFPNDVVAGEQILLDDGKLVMEVVSTNQIDEVEAKIIHGGKLFPKKGVNLPNTKISLPCLTEKDLRDFEFIIQHDPDWIALSFVRDAEDINELRKLINDKNSFAKIIAKIEKPQALENIDEIIDASDAIMIARGDLGVEVPIEDMPIAQKDITKRCHVKSKPVIIATQIMESMMESPQPTRAEINDVANAVMDGASALMLSGETSVGKFPVKVIENMQKIIRKVENNMDIFHIGHEPNPKSNTFISDSVCKSAVTMSQLIDAKAIVGMTVSGYTAFQLASWRPKAFIFIFSGNKRLLSQLSLVWGVRGYYYDNFISTDITIDQVNKILSEKGYLNKGDLIVNTASMPIDDRGRTNAMKISVCQ